MDISQCQWYSSFVCWWHLLACIDVRLLYKTISILLKTFEMKEHRQAPYLLGIEFHRDKSRGYAGIVQKSIYRGLKWFNMQSCSLEEVLKGKGDKVLNLNVLRINLRKGRWNIFLVCLQLEVWCLHKSHDIAYVVSVLGRLVKKNGSLKES